MEGGGGARGREEGVGVYGGGTSDEVRENERESEEDIRLVTFDSFSPSGRRGNTKGKGKKKYTATEMPAGKNRRNGHAASNRKLLFLFALLRVGLRRK